MAGYAAEMSFLPRTIVHSLKTVYELKDSMRRTDNMFIVCESFNPAGDTEV